MQDYGVRPVMTGDVINTHFRVEQIKSGTMGIVYLCTDKRTKEPIAFKTFKDQFLDSEINRRRFIDESMLWIRLDAHPNIVRAYSLKKLYGKLFLMIERIIPSNPRGATLKDLFFSRPLSIHVMIQIAIHICDGMVHALSKHPYLVHRDLKPENILIGEDLIPKISDFGMTQRLEQVQPEPSTPPRFEKEKVNLSHLAFKMEGTPAFASPEQCMGKPLDTRSDIYSTGCLLYHMCTKRIPFRKQEVEDYILAHINEPPLPPIELNPDLTYEFSQAIIKCMQKKPENRFQTFALFRDELCRIYQGIFSAKPKSFPIGSPLSVEEYIERSRSFILIDEIEYANEELEKARHIAPDRGDVLIEMGRLKLKQENYKKAIAYFEMAQSLLENSADLFEMMGDVYRQVNLTQEAESCYHSSVKLYPDWQGPYVKYADLLLFKKQPQKAEEILHEGLELCAERKDIYLKLASVYHRNGNTRKERDTLKQAVDENPDDAELPLLLAELFWISRDRRQAVRFLDKTVHKENLSFDVLYRIGMLYQQMNYPSHACDVWTFAARTGEGDGKFEYELAALMYNLRNYRGAWAHVLRAEELGEEVDALKRKIQAARFRHEC